MEHHPTRLSYDHQMNGHDLQRPDLHNDGHMISYDQQGQAQQQTSMPQMMMMKMYFHFGLGETVLFESVVIDSRMKMWLASLALFLAAILLEAIDYSRSYLSCRCASTSAGNGRHTSACSQSQLINGAAVRNEPDGGQNRWPRCRGSQGPVPACLVPDGQLGPALKEKLRYFPVQTTDSRRRRALQSGLHFLRTGLSLCLMLVAMTYNVCLIFPILLGKCRK